MLKFEVPDIPNTFMKRQGTLLDALEAAGKKCGKGETMKQESVRPMSNSNKIRSMTKSFRGKESIFKVPDIPRSRIKMRDIISNKKGHSKKWTKYSLMDVSDEDMSESSNTRAAFSFLKEMEDKKQSIDNDDTEFTENFKPVFRKPAYNKYEDSSEYNSEKIKNNRIIIEKINKKRENKSIVRSPHCNISQVKLHHLEYDDEDCN